MVCVWAADRKPEFREIVTSGVRAAAYLDWKSQIYFEAEGKVLVRGSDRGPIVVRCADGYLGFYYRPGAWAHMKRVLGVDALEDRQSVVYGTSVDVRVTLGGSCCIQKKN